jgi:pilus assembly protein Flp/PilA
MLSLYTGLTTWWADLKERLSEDRGATAVEYALMVALIAVVIILAVTFIGTSASTKFSQVGSAVNQAGSYGCCSERPSAARGSALKAGPRGADDRFKECETT